MLLLWQTLLPLVLSAALARPGPWGAEGLLQQGGPLPLLTPPLPLPLAALPLTLPLARTQRRHAGRVAHATDDVLHAGALGPQVLVGEALQVEAAEGGVGGEGRGPAEGGRPGGEAVLGAVSVSGGAAAGVLCVDL